MHDYRTDEHVIPVSAGIPPIVVIAGLVGLVLIGVVVSLVFVNSSWGHSWPSTSSLTLNLSNNTAGAHTK